jgi:hypothetical protein
MFRMPESFNPGEDGLAPSGSSMTRMEVGRHIRGGELGAGRPNEPITVNVLTRPGEFGCHDLLVARRPDYRCRQVGDA